MKNILYTSVPLFFCIALSSTSLQAQACVSLAYFSWSAQCNSVTFTPKFSSPTISYSWTFGDGGTSTAAAPAHLYTNPPGTYMFNVNLSVVSGACMDDTTIMVTVTIPVGGGVPTAAIALPATPDLCAPAAITFAYPPSVTTDNNPATTYTYTVQTGCEPPFTTTIPHTTPFTPFTHTFLRSSCDPLCTVPGVSPGTFRVIMVATNACGTTRDTLEVRIASPGALGFTAPMVAFAGDSICLTDTSTPGYAWNATTQMCGNAKYWEIMPPNFNVASGTLGNINSPGSSNPCIRFTKPGSYMVSLIRPAGACPADTVKKIITVPCDSLANFTSIATCNSVTFTPKFIDPSATYSWNFGDGSSSNEISPTHFYLPPINPQYSVILTVISGTCINQDSIVVPVSIAAGGLPVASMISLGLPQSFTHCLAIPSNPAFNLGVQNTSSNVTAATMYNINWGDGMFSTPNPFGITGHLFTAMGTFPIVLTAVNQNGCVDTAHYTFFNGREPGAGIGIPPSQNQCVLDTIQFEFIPSMAQNPPGTIYIITVETPCEPLYLDTLLHTDPLTQFQYVFNRGSCEPDCLSSTNPGTFLVTVEAKNACGSLLSPTPPRISLIEDANFDLVDQACVGDTVCAINTSDTSHYWNQFEGECDTLTNKFWTISPSIGFTLTSGSLGIKQFNVSGSDDICLNFTDPGTYTITLENAPPPVNPCPGNSITKTICILPQPIANFNFPQLQPACAPTNSTITFNNTSNTLGNCRPAAYKWEVEFLDSECGNDGGYTFLNNTDSNSINPRIRFDSSGRYLIRLIVENDCGIDTTTREVIFGGTPFATIVPIDDACDSLMVTPTVQSTNSCNGMAPDFQWIIQNPLMPSIFDTLMVNEIPGLLNYNIPGTYIIRLRAIGECGTSISADTFTIHPIPAPPIITSNTPVCQGQCLTVNVQNPNPIFEYAWVTPCDPPGTVNTSNVLICPADPACTGLYQLTITDPSSDLRCSLMVSTSALVYAAPPFDLQLDTVSICSGLTGTILVINGGPSYTYQWSPDTLLNTTVGPVVIVGPLTVTTQTILKYIVKVTDTLNNCSATDTATVIFNPLPIVAIAPPGTACAGDSLQLNATSNHTGSGVWTTTPGATFIPPDQNPTQFLSNISDTYPIVYTFTDDNGCVRSAFSSVCVQPKPDAKFNLNDSTVCAPFQVITDNTSNTLNTCGITTYDWQVLFDTAECHNGTGMLWNFQTGSNINSISPVINFLQSGVYRLVLTVTNDCGTSSKTTTVTVGAAPQIQSIDPIDNACDSLFLMPTAQILDCNTMGTNLSWRLDGIAIPDVFPNPPGILVTTDGPHTVFLVASNGCGGDTLARNFTIHPLPPVPVVTSNGVLCEGDDLVITIHSPTNTNLEYCWTGPNFSPPNPCSSDTFLIIPNVTTANAGTYTVIVTNLSTMPACTSSATITVVVNPAPPITFQADTVRICLGQSDTLRVIESGYSNYTWSPIMFLDPPATGQVVTVRPITAPDTLHYTVTVTNGLTCTNSATAVVIANSLPVLTIAPPATACDGQPLQLTATSDHPGTGMWMSTPAGPMFDTTTSNPTLFTGTQGTYVVKYVFTDTNMCQDSVFTSVCVQPQPMAQFGVDQSSGCISPISPSLQVSTTNTSNTLNTCGNTNNNWEVFFDGAECHSGTGMWDFETGSSATSVNPVFNFSESGVYRLVLTVTNECGTSSDTTTVTVGEAPQAAIDPVGNACDSLFLIPTGNTLSCNAPGLTLTWFLDGITFANPPGIGVGIDGQHTVTMVATNVCGTDSASTNFTIHPLPPVPVITSNGILCERDTLVLTVNSPAVPNMQYCWTGPGLPTPDTCVYGLVLTLNNVTTLTAGTYTVTVRDTTIVPACASSATITVVVNPAPPITFQADTIRVCLGQSGILQVNETWYVDYQWSPTDSLNPTFGPVVMVTPGTAPAILHYTVTVTDTLTCRNSDSAVVIVNPLPVLAISPPDTACAGQPLQLMATSDHPGMGVWETTLPATVIPPNQNPTTFTGPQGTYPIKYVFIDTNLCSDSAFTSICVQPQPIAQFDISQSSDCISPLSPTLQVTTNNTSNTQNTCGITTYNWQIVFDTAECHSGPGIWNFEPGSSDMSLNPVINFGQSGVYLLVLTVTNECGNSSATDTVTVGEAPQVLSIDSIGNACDTLFLVPTAQVLACNATGLVLTWFLDGIPFPNPPGIGVGLEGLHVVTVVANNNCGSDTLSTTFTIHPLPPTPVATSNGPLCERDTLVLTVTSPVGLNFVYCFMGPNLDTCVTDSFFILPNVTLADTGLYMVTVRDTSTVPACSASATIMVVVNPAPPIIFQTDTVRICSGQSGIIQVINGQQGYIYNWSPATFLDTTAGPLVTVTPGTVTSVLTQYYTVTITDTLTCTNSDSALVIVNPLPVLAIAPPATACTDVQLSISATSSQPGTGDWTSIPSSPVFTTISSNPTLFEASDTGTYLIRYVFTDVNMCQDSVFTSVCVQPQPIAQFTIDQASGCISSMSPTLQVVTTNNSNTLNTCGNITYNWQVLFDSAQCHSGMGMWSFEPGSSATSVSPVFNFSESGVYRLVLTVTNDCGTSSDTTTVTVGEAPQVMAINPINDACDALFLMPTGQVKACNGSGLGLSWYLDGILFLNPPGTLVNLDGQHIVELVAANVCGADTSSTTFTIHPLPPVPVVTSNGPLCERDTLVLRVTSPLGANLQYCWTGPGIPLPGVCSSNPIFTIPNVTPANTGPYTVTVTNQSTVPACTASATITVVVNPAPPITFQADTVRICLGQSGTIQVNDTSYVNYQWSPGTLLDTTMGPIVIVTPGTAPAILHYAVMVADTLTCTNTDTVVVIVNPLPVLAIAPPATACTGVQLSISATSSQPGTGAWTSTPSSPVFTTISSNPTLFEASDTGTYLIRYVFTDINGCIDSTFTSVCVQPQPNAQFTVSAPTGCVPFQVTTTNTSNTLNTCGNTTYNWNVFFDGAECHNGTGMWSYETGSNASSFEPVFNFTQSGVYRLVLTVTNECGTASSTATVTVGEAPQITSFTAIPPVVCEPYVFNAMASALGCNSATTYRWSFAGSSGIQSSTMANPGPIPYNVPGNYTIKLVVENACGKDSVVQIFQVQALPSITAAASNTTGCVPVDVAFSNQPVTGVTYVWNFGDGSSPVTTANPGNHVYNIPGTYTITLTATDVYGCSRTSALATVQANPVPIAGFALPTTVLCKIPQSLCVTDNSVGATIYTWTTTPAIGPIAPTSNPCLSINTEGNYTITQVVSNQFGCTASVTLPYTAYDTPVASFGAIGDSSGCEDLLIQFDNLSQHAEFVEWQINSQVVTLDSLNPSYLFTDPGAYDITLIVGNGSGCTDTLTRNGFIQVFPTPVAGFEFAPLPNEWPITFRFRDKSSHDAVYFGWNFGETMDVDSEEKNPKYRYQSTADKLITHWVRNAFGCVDSITAVLPIDVDGDLFVPNILEPANNDHAEKQIFLPKGYNLAEYHIAVFARTGQLIWESTLLDAGGHPVESWDGKLNGTPLPSGVFVWKVIKAVFISGREWDGMLDEQKVKRKTNFLYLMR